jgi:hypothetical protein
MFSFFSPHCPVDAYTKAWIEARLRWLAAEFGLDVFTRRAFILPNDDFFPQPLDGTEDSLRALLDQVCGYMDVDPERVELRLFSDRNHPELVNEQGHYLSGAAGTYHDDGRRAVIRLEVSHQLDDPVCLIGTMAHELAHARLLGEGRIFDDIFDHELLTDLTVVFHGMGVFLANTPRHWTGDFSYWPGTEFKKPEYMTLPMFGYALAHAAWFRNEAKPAWAKHLSWHARSTFKQGLRYLRKTGDSTFKPRPAR